MVWCKKMALLLLCIVLTGSLICDGNQEDLKRLATANNNMAVNIYRLLAAQTDQNIFFSPLSLSTAFGMLYYGTRGNTAQELRKALGYDTAGLPDDLVHQAFHSYFSEYFQSQDPSAYVLNLANAILLDKHLTIVPSYICDVQNLYNATVQDVDFFKQGPRIVNEINSWVRDKTNGKIEKLLDKLDPFSTLVILNAIYFKGAWKTQFDRRYTSPDTFYNYGVLAKKVPMMRERNEFSYLYTSNTEAVELPYIGVNVSMVILVPKTRNGLESLERNLTLEKISAIRQQLNKTEIVLTIPKFKIEYSKEMSREFKILGARSVFTPGGDFSGISSDPNIFVSEVFHKAVVEVNEEGSEAAAATAITHTRSGAYFTVDHPFLFIIVDKRTDMILFMGRVTNI